MSRKNNKPHDGCGLSSYISEIKKFPILEGDEEFALVMKWRETGDKRALDKIVKSHLRLVAKIAGKYAGYGFPQTDLIAEGNIGIMHALKHFDPATGHRFSTYATWWIKAKIKKFIYNSWSIVKLSSSNSSRKLFFGLKKSKNVLGVDKLCEDGADKIATKLNVKKKDVVLSEQRLSGKDYSTNVPLSDSEGAATMQDFLACSAQCHGEALMEKQENNYRMKVFQDALSTLSEREYEITCAYRLQQPPKTLREIAKDLNISAERVRQIEGAAFQKIQKYVKGVEWESASKKRHVKTMKQQREP